MLLPRCAQTKPSAEVALCLLLKPEPPFHDEDEQPGSGGEAEHHEAFTAEAVKPSGTYGDECRLFSADVRALEAHVEACCTEHEVALQRWSKLARNSMQSGITEAYIQ